MTDEKLAELIRRQAEGVRAMSNEEMARRQLEAADGMRNAWPDGVDSVMLAQASMNFWRHEGPFLGPFPFHPVQIQSPPTRWERFKRWFRA
jgi:hypothetical protein